MIRYERTGEYRVPIGGEWFEAPGNGAPHNWDEGGWLASQPAWILCRIAPSVFAHGTGQRAGPAETYCEHGTCPKCDNEATAAAPAPPARERPGTEEVVTWLQEAHVTASVDECLAEAMGPHCGARRLEAIRRVKAYDRAWEWAKGNLGFESMKDLLAILDADAKGDGT